MEETNIETQKPKKKRAPISYYNRSPSRLSEAASKKYLELAPYYRLTTPLLVETLAQYCELWETYVRAQKDLLASDSVTVNDGKAEHGAAKIQFKALDSMRRLLNVLTDNTKEVKETKTLADSLDLD